MENKDKLIINIGRQVGSGGRIIAKLLADEFECQFYDKEILNLAAKESGFSEKFFEQNDEQRGFIQTLFSMHAPLISDNNFYNNKFSQDGLFQFQSEAITKAADEGSCVFVGRAADYVLRTYPNVVNIFITADMKDRIKLVCQRLGCDEKDAKKLIIDKESERASYYNYYTGKKWGHSCSYDLCINSSIMGLEKTADIIGCFIRRRFELDNTEKGRKS